MEYSLLVIKPNSFIDEISKLVEWQMTEFGIGVVKKKTMHLSREQLDEAFTTKADRSEFVNYMGSGAVNVYLVCADYAVQKLKELKEKIRKMWRMGKSDLNNIVHSSDEGIEYYKQFHVCFPELDIIDYPGYVDFHVRLTQQNYSQIKETIERKTDNVLSIIYNKDNAKLAKEIYDERHSNCIFGKEIEFEFKDIPYKIICYGKKMVDQEFKCIKDATSYFASMRGFTALNSLSLDRFDDNFLFYLKKNGVDAAFATPAADSLFLSRNIQEYFESHDFVAIHGGESDERIFEVTDSKKTYDKLMGRQNGRC